MAVSVKAKSTVSGKKIPVLEAIFEMRWDLPQVTQGQMQVRRDPAYPLLYGRMYDRFKKDYATVEDLPSVQMHPDAGPYVVRHRMKRAAPQAWPLVQIGPGIITIHEGKGFGWENYRQEIIRIFEAFTDFYPASTFPLKIVKAELRFISGIDMEEGEDPLKSLNDKLHTKVEFDPGLFSGHQVQKQAEGFSLTSGFKIAQPAGAAMIAFGTGTMENKTALIQQMAFQSLGDDAPQDLGLLDPWLDDMYKIAEHWFATLCR
jgi:uncharacterized protein (TIGR04255 family)